MLIGQQSKACGVPERALFQEGRHRQPNQPSTTTMTSLYPAIAKAIQLLHQLEKLDYSEARYLLDRAENDDAWVYGPYEAFCLNKDLDEVTYI